jgi:hypothetical protein
MRWKMKPVKNEFHFGFPVNPQEEFAPYASLRGSSTGVVARVESLRGRMSEAGRQVSGLFESLLAESFS